MARTTVRIAVLDDYAGTSNQILSTLREAHSDLSIEVDHYSDTINTRSPVGIEAAVRRLEPYAIISSMRERTPFPADLISQLPNLKLLLTTGTRNAAIDLDACQKHNVRVAGTVGHSKSVSGFDSTNEQTWALILGVAKKVAEGDANVKKGAWQNGLVSILAGKTLGLLGLGKLGTQCAVTGKLGFGMKILCWSENLTQEKADKAAESRGLPQGSFQVAASKEQLFQRADILSVHYVLSDRSRGIIGKQELDWMKSTAILVNTSRGPLIDEVSLVDALKEKRIRGVGLDVFDTEPLPDDSIWRSRDWPDGVTVLISPHMGYVVEETMESWYEQTADNIKRFLRKEELLHVISS